MKTITQLALVAALAFGAQAAWSDEAVQASETESAPSAKAESYSGVGATGASSAGAAMSGSSKSREPSSLLKGLVSDDGFPSRGGPIDD